MKWLRLISLTLLVSGFLLGVVKLKPASGSALNTGSPYYATLTHAYPLWSLTGTDLVTSQATVAGSTSPDSVNDSTYGQGWGNTAAANKNIDTQLTTGFIKGLTTFATVAVVRVDAVGTMYFAADSVADSAASVRYALATFNNAGGTTGNKWDVSFRTGAAASTVRHINPAAGGTAVGASTYWVVGFDFDSTADVYTLYVNGVQEAQSTVAETAIANTNPNTTPRFLTSTDNTTNLANGVIFFFGVWNNTLGATAHAAFAENPWLLFSTGMRHKVTNARLSDFPNFNKFQVY